MNEKMQNRGRVGVLTRRLGLIAILALALGCAKGQSTVVAEYAGGTISLADFSEFSAMVAADRAIRPPDLHEHGAVGSPEDQEAILLRLVDLRLAAAEARSQKLQDTGPFVSPARAEQRTQLEAFMIQIFDFIKEPRYHFVEVQHLYRVGASEGEAAQWAQKLRAVPAARIDDFVAANTQLAGFNATAGRQLPLCASCGNPTHQFLVSAALGAADGEFVRVPGVVAGGIWFVRLLSRKTVSEAALADYFRPFYLEQARRLAVFRTAGGQAPGHGIPAEPKEVEKSLKERILFDRTQQAKQAEWGSFLALTLGRLAERGQPWPTTEEARSQAMYAVWAKDADFAAAQRTDRALRRKRIRDDELLAGLLYEKEAHPVQAREGEVRRLYSEHLRNLGTGPGLERAGAGLRADIRHRKQHVIIDRLRGRLRKSRNLKLYTDRLR